MASVSRCAAVDNAYGMQGAESGSSERVKTVSRWDGDLMLIEKRSADTDIVRSAIRQQNHLDVTYPRFLHRIEHCCHLSLDTEI